MITNSVRGNPVLHPTPAESLVKHRIAFLVFYDIISFHEIKFIF
jgi:hypothetical protein